MIDLLTVIITSKLTITSSLIFCGLAEQFGKLLCQYMGVVFGTELSTSAWQNFGDVKPRVRRPTTQDTVKNASHFEGKETEGSCGRKPRWVVHIVKHDKEGYI